MNISTSLRSPESHEWLTQLAASRTHVLAQARAGRVDTTKLSQVTDTEAEFTLILHPIPEDVVAHIRAAHTYAHPYLERLLGEEERHDEKTL